MQHITGGPGNVGDDGAVDTGQGIEQTGFARVGPARNHHLQTLAQQLPLPGRRLHCCDRRLDSLQQAEDFAIGQKINFLFRKINRCLDMQAHVDQLRQHRLHPVRKLSLQRTQRRPGRRLTAGVDQVGNRLGLHQIQLAMVKRTGGKLSRLCRGGPKRIHARQQAVLHHHPGMALQLHHILARERVRGREVQHQPLIQRLACGIAEHRKARLSWRWQWLAGERCRDRGGLWPGQADHPDAAPALRGGNRGNGGADRAHLQRHLIRVSGAVFRTGHGPFRSGG